MKFWGSMTMGLCGLACIATVPAQAAPRVFFDSAVYVERQPSAEVRSLEPAGNLIRGDRVVTVVNWQRHDGTGSFTVVNPVPRAITYQGSANADEEVSTDGGRTWGRLGALRMGNRLATPEDVTHVRWRLNAARPGARGRITYAGIVR